MQYSPQYNMQCSIRYSVQYGTVPYVAYDACPEVCPKGLLPVRFLQPVDGHHAIQRVTTGREVVWRRVWGVGREGEGRRRERKGGE